MDKWITIAISTTVIALATLIIGVTWIGVTASKAKFVAATEAGLEQQQRKGTTYWLWAYPDAE